MCLNRLYSMINTDFIIPYISRKTNWNRQPTNNLIYSQIFDNSIHCWKFPRWLSQSKIAGREVPSSACTFIALTLAQFIQGKQCNLADLIQNDLLNLKNIPLAFPIELLDFFTNAIIDANATHEQATAARRKQSETFSIPDAIKYGNETMYEIDFMIYKGCAWLHLYNVIKRAYNHAALKNIQHLCFVFISIERAILIVCERKTDTIFVFDSHCHNRGNSGAYVSAAKIKDLLKFSIHIFSVFFPDLIHKHTSTTKFEISCVHIVDFNSKKVSAKVFPRLKPKFQIQNYKEKV